MRDTALRQMSPCVLSTRTGRAWKKEIDTMDGLDTIGKSQFIGRAGQTLRGMQLESGNST
jgi:hypothetical protein